ncbi:MAG: ATP-binding protein [Gammaproteobacteria bacterium]|nr:ATP-binding protein [Gammaproteobacteria bacterium]
MSTRRLGPPTEVPLRPSSPKAFEKGLSCADKLTSGLDALRQLLGERMGFYLDSRKGRPVSINSQVRSDLGRFNLPLLIPEIHGQRENFLLLLGLVPHIEPDFFESVVMEHMPEGGNFPLFGGIKGTGHRGLLPTGETAQFVLAGEALEARLDVCTLFDEEHIFSQRGILSLEPVKEGEPAMGGRIMIAQEWVDKLVFGKIASPRFGVDFPARRVSTRMGWDDAVLHTQTRRQVEELALWLGHRHRLMADENLGRKIKPGYRVLFYGPSGTGKTLTAALLGKRFGHDVYRIDLSQVVSKYIGETEKNLEGVFSRAQTRDWVLFFDEADALFGKRTNVQSAHDKYANQEVSYLLQRVEEFPGLLILASNYKNNLDEAFLRRFHSLVHFPMPGQSDRLELWRKSLPSGLELADDVDLLHFSKTYEMSGAGILNAVQAAALQVYARDGEQLELRDLVEGVRKEFMKEEKSI